MNMQSDTENRKAFELVSDALLDIDKYKAHKELAPLQDAKGKLEAAIREDPHYIRAHYFAGITYDLVGLPAEAVERLEQVLRATPPFKEEVEYNLGVAYYHRYSAQYIDKAIKHFNAVIQTSREIELVLLARAALAQAYAVRMIPGSPEEADLEEIKRYYQLSEAQRKQTSVALMSRVGIDEATRLEVEWTLHNAAAIAHMF